MAGRRKKRHICIDAEKEMQVLAVCLFLLSLFAACVQEKGQKNAKGGVQTDAYEQISLYCDVDFWKPAAWSTDPDTITGEITEKTGVAVDVTVPSLDADRKLSLMILNDRMPDVISVTDTTVIRQLISSGKVWNLEEFLQAYCPDSHLLTQFPEDIRQALVKRDGAWYAYPSHINSSDARRIWKPSSQYYEDYIRCDYNNAVIWNKSLLHRLGISQEELHTEEQVLAAFQKAAESDLLVRGKSLLPILIDGNNYQESTLQFLLNTFGAEYLDEDGNYRDILLSPQAKHALKFLQTVFAEGYCSSDMMTITNEKVKEYAASGRVLCFIGNIANLSSIGREWVSSGAVLSSDGALPVLGKNLRASTGWLSTFIAKDCACPERVAAWLDYMTGDEGMRLWNFGYEGRHYSCDSQGLIVRTKEQERLDDWYSQTGIGTWWMFYNASWSKSVLKAPETGSVEELGERAHTAFGRDAETVIYDNGPFLFSDMISGDGVWEDRVDAVNKWEEDMIAEVILAKEEEEFEQKYARMVDGMMDRGIEAVDRRRNVYFRERCRELGVVPEKVNK